MKRQGTIGFNESNRNTVKLKILQEEQGLWGKFLFCNKAQEIFTGARPKYFYHQNTLLNVHAVHL